MISVQVLTVHYLYTFSKGAGVVALDGFWAHLLGFADFSLKMWKSN